jgi:O-antigen ligase
VLIVALAALYPWHIALFATSFTGKDPVIPHGGLNISLGDSVIIIISVILVLQAGVGRVRLPRYTRPAALWLLATAISVTVNAVTPDVYFAMRDSVMGLVKITAAMMWMVAVFWLLQDSFPRRFLQLAGTSVAMACYFAVESVIENVFQGRERAFGPFENANLYGNYVVLNLFLAIAIDRFLGDGAAGTNLRPATRAFWRSLVRYGAVTLLLLGLLATGSRGAIVGFLAGLIPALPWAHLKRVSWRGIVAAVFGVMVLVPALVWYFDQNPYVVSRVEATAEGRGPNVEERFELWEGAVHAFSSSPLVGIGYSQFPNWAEHEPGLRATVTHNTYLATASELGILGLLALGWLLITVLLDSWRIQDKAFVGLAHGCCGFVFAACTQGLFNNVQQERSLWIVFGIIAALIFHLQRRRLVTPG